eukprot:COSAG01_NODE_1643_length_9640_cov_366.002725_3_plen_197_part_00
MCDVWWWHCRWNAQTKQSVWENPLADAEISASPADPTTDIGTRVCAPVSATVQQQSQQQQQQQQQQRASGYGGGPPTVHVPRQRSLTSTQRTAQPRWALNPETGSWVAYEDAHKIDDHKMDQEASVERQHTDEPHILDLDDVSSIGWSDDESSQSPCPESAAAVGEQFDQFDQHRDQSIVGCDGIMRRPYAPPDDD